MGIRIERPYRVYKCLSCTATDETHGQPIGRTTDKYGTYYTCPDCGRVVLTKIERRLISVR